MMAMIPAPTSFRLWWKSVSANAIPIMELTARRARSSRDTRGQPVPGHQERRHQQGQREADPEEVQRERVNPSTVCLNSTTAIAQVRAQASEKKAPIVAELTTSFLPAALYGLGNGRQEKSCPMAFQQSCVRNWIRPISSDTRAMTV